MHEFVAFTSRWRTTFVVLGSIAFVIIGVWMVGLFGPPPVSKMAMFWGWVTIIFFGMGAIVTAKIWWKNEEQLCIGPEGIKWLRWHGETIPWEEINDVTEWQYKGVQSIILHLDNPDRFPGKGLAGFAGRANRTLTGGDIGISLIGTDRTFDEAMAAIKLFRPVR